MKLRLLNLAAGVSLLLAIAIVLLWVRSHGRCEVLGRSWSTATEADSQSVQSGFSSLSFTFSRIPFRGSPSAPRYGYDRPEPDKARSFHWFPFPPMRFYHSFGAQGSFDMMTVDIAYWLLLPLTLVLPAIAIARHRRRRHRETNNLCPTCGYDLRATPDRCPECGTSREMQK